MTLTPTPASQALLAALLPETGNDATAATDALYAVMEPLHDALTAAKTRAHKLDRARRMADAEETDPRVFAHFEQIAQKLRALLREVANAEKALDQVTDISYRVDQLAIEMQASLSRPDATGPAVVTRNDRGNGIALVVVAQGARAGIDTRAADQGEAMGEAFAAGTLPDADRRGAMAVETPAASPTDG